MAKKKTVVPFNGTKEQEAQLAAVIEKYKDVQGALMPVLQEAQQIYGYLPIEVQIMIAEEGWAPMCRAIARSRASIWNMRKS